jgi:NADPH:quinone reductase
VLQRSPRSTSTTRNGAISQAGLLAPHHDIGLGWDVAGTVDAVGAGVRRFAVGDEVIGLRDLLFAFPGAHAEYVVRHEGALAHAPRGTPHEHAATIPLAGLTADRAPALAGLQPGQTRHCWSPAPPAVSAASSSNARDYGTHAPSPSRAPTRSARPSATSRQPESTPSSTRRWRDRRPQALRGGGTFVALVAAYAPPPIRGTNVVVQEVYADGGRLAELSALSEAGRLTPRVAQTIPLAGARGSCKSPTRMARYGYEPGVGCAAYRRAAARGVQHSECGQLHRQAGGGQLAGSLVTAEF